MLNCCGEHDITVTQQPDGSYLVLETDIEGDEGRCRCECVFDYQVSIENIPLGTIDVVIQRSVEPETVLIDVWSGTLDLAEGGGAELIDDSSAEPWCSEGDTAG